ncbi:helix-turn-helix domain-containing protein [SAR202 cluster bacterium AC-647-N09_OGT_505m]|nr:helix-turn-helix domain-containing protein [SAR202 cluster bacterium AC-647-N09_OGT_505m]
MNDEKDLITVTEAAELLGYSLEHTRILLRNHQILGTRIGQDWLIHRKSILERSRRLQQSPSQSLEESEIFLRPSAES